MNMLNDRLEKVLEDPLQFISRLKIINKLGELCNLRPTAEQLKMYEALEGDKDCLFLKPRQIGSTTFVSAWLFYKWFTAKEPITIAILSHKISSAKHMLSMYKRFYSTLPKQLQRELIVENTTEMVFADTGAKIMAVSAEGKGGLRSFTCNFLHMSEYAFAPNPEELKATAIGALNGNRLIIESTANHYRDALHQEVIKAQRGEGHWNYQFFPWFQHPNYISDYPEGWKCEDLEYQRQHMLTQNQMYWRACMIHRLGTEKFRREYPATLEEAFAQAGTAYFSDEDLRYIETKNVEAINNKKYIWTEPDFNNSYAIGVDVASGRGGDYSVITVMDKISYQPVAMFRSNTTVPVDLADKIIILATKYNDAKVLVEENNWGLPVLNELRNRGYYNLWSDQKGKDWITTTKSKIILFEELKALLSEGVITQLDSITYTELRSYQLDDRGLAPKVPSNLDHHGDTVIALALACQCLKQVQLHKSAYLPDWIKERRVQRVLDTSFGQKEKRY